MGALCSGRDNSGDSVPDPLRYDLETAPSPPPPGARAPVYLHVYDLTILNYSSGRFGVGVYHTSVCVYGLDFQYIGMPDREITGIRVSSPRDTSWQSNTVFNRACFMGYTAYSDAQIISMVNRLQSLFLGPSYNLVMNNCNSFSDMFLKLILMPDSLRAHGFSCELPEEFKPTPTHMLSDSQSGGVSQQNIGGSKESEGDSDQHSERKQAVSSTTGTNTTTTTTTVTATTTTTTTTETKNDIRNSGGKVGNGGTIGEDSVDNRTATTTSSDASNSSKTTPGPNDLDLLYSPYWNASTDVQFVAPPREPTVLPPYVTRVSSAAKSLRSCLPTSLYSSVRDTGKMPFVNEARATKKLSNDENKEEEAVSVEFKSQPPPPVTKSK